MTTPIVGSRVKLEVQSALASAKTVADVTVDSSGVATVASTAHGYSNGDIIVFNVTDGMVELDGQAVRVANSTTDAYEIDDPYNVLGIDSFSDWVSGTTQKVTAFVTAAAAQNISAPDPTPNKLEYTTLIDRVRQYVYGLPDAPDGSISGLLNIGGAAEAIVQQATQANTRLVFRVNWAGGQKTILNANVSGGQGFDVAQNAVATAKIAFTPRGQILHYVS